MYNLHRLGYQKRMNEQFRAYDRYLQKQRTYKELEAAADLMNEIFIYKNEDSKK